MRHFTKIVLAVAVVSIIYGPTSPAQGNGTADLRQEEAKQPKRGTWWKHAVIYEVYPRSFADSNGDGVGDLNGITAHLDYLQKLGVDAIWLAPIYPSPQVDCGYDISNYTDIDSQYGTLADFDRLRAEAEKRHIWLILDMVLNHTSDQSEWFKESASSRSNSKADWYVWSDGIIASSPNLAEWQKSNIHDGPNGKVVPPNNWKSYFGGSAWEWVPARKQFYYHLFYRQLPDLNWREPAVETAMMGVLRFWLDRGVSGFRLDAIQALYEDQRLQNATNPEKPIPNEHAWNMPEVHDVLRRLRTMVDSYPGHRILIGELSEAKMTDLDKWYGGTAHNELQLPMDYTFGFPPAEARKAGEDGLPIDFFRKQLMSVESEVHGSQPLLFFDNHDSVRSMDRFGDGEHNTQIAKVIAALLLTPRATAQMYYGSELGMATTNPTRKEDVRDPVGISQWPVNKGRDGERTPMQWTAGPQAGFSVSPLTWLPIPASYRKANVQVEERDSESLLNWYRSLIALRRNNRSLHAGEVVFLNTTDPSVLSFVRTVPKGKPVIVVMNLKSHETHITLNLDGAGVRASRPETLLSSAPMQPSTFPSVTLVPFQVWIASLQ
jgi:alpha-glucosidase